MADQTDVANALVSRIETILYPNGKSKVSISGTPIAVFQGWPDPSKLDAALKDGSLQISVWPTPTERVLSSTMQEWQQLSVSSPTVTLTVAANQIIVSGTGSANQNAALLIDGKPYVYAVQANDTPTMIATALAALVNFDQAATNAGAVITVPGAHSITARVGAAGVSIRELRRQEKIFQISVWANCFDKRDPVASIVDASLAGINRLTFTDGSQGILRYRSSIQIDSAQKSGIYRRDMLYAVEYATTEVRTGTQVTIDQLGVSALAVGTESPIGQITTYS